MTTIPTRLEGHESIAHGTMAFQFAKPADFTFAPGQAIDVVLLEPPDGQAASARHTFSIVTAPFEAQLGIATRMRDSSAFKRALAALPIGAALAIEGPTGSLTLDDDRTRAAVFIAGGIGITPFMSLLRQAAHDGSTQPMWLLYANHRPEDAAFLAELQALEQRHPAFRLVATMTRMGHSSQVWAGPTGPIDEALIGRSSAGLARPVYYIAGPPAMVEALRLTLGDAGIADADIRSEEFYGY
jgi:ferredoxin-NADP reductase